MEVAFEYFHSLPVVGCHQCTHRWINIQIIGRELEEIFGLLFLVASSILRGVDHDNICDYYHPLKTR